MRSVEKHGRAASVVAAAIARSERAGIAVPEAGEDEHGILHRFQWRERAGERVASAIHHGRPVGHDGAVRHVTEAEAQVRFGRGIREERVRGNHGIQ